MKHVILMAALGSSLVGCGGGSDAPTTPAAATPGDGVRYLALVSSLTFSFDAAPPSTSLIAVFSELVFETPAADLIEAVREEAAGCVVRRMTRAELDAERAERDALFPPAFLIDAGDVLPITTPTGTWPALARRDPSDLPGTYGSGYEEDVSGALPAGSTLHVPGGAFPAITGVELPVAEPLTGVAFREGGRALVPDTDLATPDIRFHWDAPVENGGSRVLVTLFDTEYGEDGEFVGTRFVECDTEDTGTYAFPAGVRERMDDTYPRYSLKRIHTRHEQRGDVLISLRAESRRL